MYTDLTGRKRMKIGLHIHTTESDGRMTPKEACEIYRSAGYDAIALTDHWKWHGEDTYQGMRILSGAEFNTFTADTVEGVVHILCIGAKQDPMIDKSSDVQTIIDKIHAAEGIAILAHPAWSLNSVKQIISYQGFDATEIYNTVSGVHASNRPYSGIIVDLLANEGVFLPLTATDDTHYYDGDETVSYIMLDVSDGKTSSEDIKRKIAAGAFYATQGPEIHLRKNEDGTVTACTSPVSCISFFSQASFNSTRNARGEGITEAVYRPLPFEKWIRAEAYDSLGRCAFSNILML